MLRPPARAVRLVLVAALISVWCGAGAARAAQPPCADDLHACLPHGCAEPGSDGQIAQGDSFHNKRFPDLKADFILANPPFNVSDRRSGLLREDRCWKYGVPPAGNANFAWVQHIVHLLAPTGLAGFVLANASTSSNQSGEGEIHRNSLGACDGN